MPSGAAAYSPVQESGAVFGYDTSVASNPITTLPDKSGNGHTLTFDATKQPSWTDDVLNGLGAGSWDASNDGGYTGAFAWGSNKATIYALFTSAAGSENYVLNFGGASGDGRIIIYRQIASSVAVGFASGNSTQAYNFSQQGISTTPTLLTVLIDKTQSTKVRMFINGVEDGTDGAPSLNDIGSDNFGASNVLYIGNNSGYTRGLEGNGFELWGFNAAHDAAARARILAYYVAKWGGPPFS